MKSSTLIMRVDRETKERIRRAAQAVGLTMSEFIRRCAKAAAKRAKP